MSKGKALQILKNYYLSFRGCQWHEFDRQTDTPLLRAKICFSMFGPPTEDADDIESAYNVEQKKKAKEIMTKILKVCHTLETLRYVKIYFFTKSWPIV